MSANPLARLALLTHRYAQVKEKYAGLLLKRGEIGGADQTK
jgi:hypothetical protein